MYSFEQAIWGHESTTIPAKHGSSLVNRMTHWNQNLCTSEQLPAPAARTMPTVH